jgi:ATP-dependent Clp protease ATP-binding subunit ClpA
VILLDEVEKAHPDVFNSLLQVLDDGRLTDGKGRTVSFKNAIVIMTSNVGSDTILDWGTRHEEIGFKGTSGKKLSREEGIHDRIMEMLRDEFKPEFLNRLDEIVVFHALGKSELAKIVDLQLSIVEKRLRAKRIAVTFTDAAKKLIAEKGYDPSYGARPLKRAIQDLVLDELSLKIIEGKISEGDAITIGAEKGNITIKK